MTLAPGLDDIRNSAKDHLPADLRERMAAATASLTASGLAETALGCGDTAPEFTLPDASGQKVSLAEKLAEGPVVLSFYRGGWCPYCNLELKALQAELPAITEQGASLVTISPQTPDASLTTAEKNELEFDVLSDVGNVVARQFGLVFRIADDLQELYGPDALNLPTYNGDASYELPIPATYVIDRDGTIAWAFVEADYSQRSEPSDIVDALRSLS